ncbi:hypothetical protein ACFQ0X_44055 [Streptomyces rectiviolaceus]|uniref:Uncharacterized protein n=1 Tax=Streptomyces rectiviolaceus TaxID=332591 RepID=A0ABP6NP28_9ACTN
MPHNPEQAATADQRPEPPQYAGLFQEPQYRKGLVYDDGEDEA